VRVDSPDGAECFVVRGSRVPSGVELEITHHRVERRALHRERLVQAGAFGIARFPLSDVAAWSRYAGELEVLARYAARGEFGHFVDVSHDGAQIRVRLMVRTFERRRLTVALVEERTFEDPSASETLVAANEYAESLRVRAAELNRAAAAERHIQYARRRDELARADREAADARELAGLVESEERPGGEVDL
jgi:hypothetical protein